MTFQRQKDPVCPVVDSQDMRDALAKFATGVTVVTAAAESGPLGITVNSFSAVSLDPPLVLFSLARSSNRTRAFERAEKFAVHILSSGQKDLCHRFTREGDAFDPEATRITPDGVPLLDGCLARFECRRHAVHDGGDHLIIVARVEAVRNRTADPLIYFDRGIGGLRG